MKSSGPCIRMNCWHPLVDLLPFAYIARTQHNARVHAKEAVHLATHVDVIKIICKWSSKCNVQPCIWMYKTKVAVGPIIKMNQSISINH